MVLFPVITLPRVPTRAVVAFEVPWAVRDFTVARGFVGILEDTAVRAVVPRDVPVAERCGDATARYALFERDAAVLTLDDITRDADVERLILFRGAIFFTA